MKNIRHSIDRNAMNLIVCIGEILIGALLLINPIGFTSAVLIALGVVLVALGAIRLVGYFRSDPEAAAQGGGLVTGLLFMLAGLFCILDSAGGLDFDCRPDMLFEEPDISHSGATTAKAC